MKKLILFFCTMGLMKITMAQPYLPLAAGSGSALSGTLYTRPTGAVLTNSPGATNNQVYAAFTNTTNNTYLGQSDGTPGSFFTGNSAYASVFGAGGNVPVELATSNIVRYSIDGSGNHDFKSGTTAFGNTVTTSVANNTNSFFASNTNGGIRFIPWLTTVNGSYIGATNQAQAVNQDLYLDGSAIKLLSPLTGTSAVFTGNVGIGTTIPDSKLAVKGKIHAEEVKVDLSVAGPDYVFKKDYVLMPLKDVEAYVTENQHLPEVASAKEMAEKGIELGEMNMKLLKKIEEMTLHLIDQNKRLEAQGEQIKQQQIQINKLSPKNNLR